VVAVPSNTPLSKKLTLPAVGVDGLLTAVTVAVSVTAVP